MKKYIQIAILFISIMSYNNSKAQWYNLGLNDKNIFRIQVFEKNLFVGTRDGLFYKEFLSTDTNWVSLGMDGNHISDFAILNLDTIIAIKKVKPDIDLSDSISLFITYNHGNTWNDYHNNFPYVHYNSSTFFKIIKPYLNLDTLVLSSYGSIWKSPDFGLSWTEVYNFEMTSLLLYNERNNPGILYFAGSWGGVMPYMIKSSDGGNNWNILSLHFDYREDNYIYTVGLHPIFPNKIYVGMWWDAGWSDDGGDNWNKLSIVDDMDTYTGIKISRNNENLIFVSTYFNNLNNGKLYFLKSNDLGISGIWDTICYANSPDNIKCYILEAFDAYGKDILLFGTNKGLFAYTEHILNSKQLSDDNDLKIEIYPNPFKDEFNYKIESTTLKIELCIYSVYGELVYKQNMKHDTGKIQTNSFKPGVYILKIKNQNNKVLLTKKIVKL